MGLRGHERAGRRAAGPGARRDTASSLWDYEAEGEPLPTAGDLSILLDGRGEPRAVLRTTDVHVAPFGEVGAGHARAEGEGDRSLAHPVPSS